MRSFFGSSTNNDTYTIIGHLYRNNSSKNIPYMNYKDRKLALREGCEHARTLQRMPWRASRHPTLGIPPHQRQLDTSSRELSDRNCTPGSSRATYLSYSSNSTRILPSPAGEHHQSSNAARAVKVTESQAWRLRFSSVSTEDLAIKTHHKTRQGSCTYRQLLLVEHGIDVKMV